MKKLIVFTSVILFLAACGSNNTDTAAPTTDTPATVDTANHADYKAGLALVAKYDCLTCHKVSEKLTGPAYVDVANKYADNEANVKMLAEKVIKGGSGNWGQVAMIAHPQVSEADAEQMVKYILLLRTN